MRQSPQLPFFQSILVLSMLFLIIPASGQVSHEEQVLSFAGCEDLGHFTAFKGVDYLQTEDNTQPVDQIYFIVDSFIVSSPGLIGSAELITDFSNAPFFEDLGMGNWESNIDFNSKAEMDAAFPSNTNYSIHVQGGDAGTRVQSFLMGPEIYPAPTYLTGTGYSDLLAIDPRSEHTIQWFSADANTTHILVELYTDDIPNGDVFSSELPPSATSVSFPANTMIGGIQYELIVVHFNSPEFIADDCPGFGVGTVGRVGHASSTTIIFTPATFSPCHADLTGDGSLDFFDVSAFLTAFGSGDPIADFTGDGSFDFFDVSAFLTAFSVGCP